MLKLSHFLHEEFSIFANKIRRIVRHNASKINTLLLILLIKLHNLIKLLFRCICSSAVEQPINSRFKKFEVSLCVKIRMSVFIGMFPVLVIALNDVDQIILCFWVNFMSDSCKISTHITSAQRLSNTSHHKSKSI